MQAYGGLSGFRPGGDGVGELARQPQTATARRVRGGGAAVAGVRPHAQPETRVREGDVLMVSGPARAIENLASKATPDSGRPRTATTTGALTVAGCCLVRRTRQRPRHR
jgi:hypothetical protein